VGCFLVGPTLARSYAVLAVVPTVIRGEHDVGVIDQGSVTIGLARHRIELMSEDEVLVFLVAHEAFHYLRKTKQVKGRHGEIEADAFALKMLEQYRDGLNTTIPPTQSSMR
jgi:hypothetical protein